MRGTKDEGRRTKDRLRYGWEGAWREGTDRSKEGTKDRSKWLSAKTADWQECGSEWGVSGLVNGCVDPLSCPISTHTGAGAYRIRLDRPVLLLAVSRSPNFLPGAGHSQHRTRWLGLNRAHHARQATPRRDAKNRSRVWRRVSFFLSVNFMRKSRPPRKPEG